MNHCLYSIVHVLNEVFLRATKASPVGNIKDSIACVRMFAMTSANLHVVLISNCLEARPISHKIGQVDVNRCSQSCTEICWAGSDIANVWAVLKLCSLFYLSCNVGESGEDSANISAWLHRYNAQLIFFIYPHKECFLLVMENTTTLGPVTIKAAGLKEPIAFFEKEMIVDKLPPHMFRHTFQRIESSCKFTSKTFTSLDNCVHNFVTLLVCDARTKRNPFEISSNSNSS